MSAHPSHADETRAFFAPDGIAILPFDLPGLAHLSFVEGRIPPRPEPYPIHLHGALEQITYVLAGRIAVTTWDAARGLAMTFDAELGDAFVTLPLEVSPRTAGSVYVMVSSTCIGSSSPMGLPLIPSCLASAWLIMAARGDATVSLRSNSRPARSRMPMVAMYPSPTK